MTRGFRGLVLLGLIAFLAYGGVAERSSAQVTDDVMMSVSSSWPMPS
jgi:hypothetical protein